MRHDPVRLPDGPMDDYPPDDDEVKRCAWCDRMREHNRLEAEADLRREHDWACLPDW